MEKQTDILFLKLLQDAVNALNGIDDLINTLSERQSKVDSEICDLLHLIENNDLSDSACINITKRLKELRSVRRHLKNEYELVNRYNELKARLSSRENRWSIVSAVVTRNKTLSEEYKNRVISDDEVCSLLDVKPKKELGIRERKNIELNGKIKELLKEGYSQKQIAEKIDLTQPSVSARIKKMKEDGVL